ncbi:hypothetical protein EJF36_18375 [Bacillus sp. HMF5848]|uniref:hypothetical protein n=1 Tax=Bacillus sp. HMF5848 TaxID=2495421 RepID=UPI000F79CA59|nr:hypothetical protein [Bacillus sp. HMF5848]RSK28675.1 hypothetical protein EJF36_18375 [Bacillus sp. HMF5848]
MKYLKNIWVILLILLVVAGCGKKTENVAEVTNNKEQYEGIVVLGKKLEDTTLQAGNVFNLGESVHFLVKMENPIGNSEVEIVLEKLNETEKQWVQLSKGKLEVDKTWTEFMNGLSSNVFEQAGAGSYQIKILKSGEEAALGQFIVNE